MAVSKDSPKRRKSIAIANQNKPAVPPRAKRRPHSIVAGDRLSPFAKARRSLVPRKSILKTFTNIVHNGEDSPDSQSPSQSATSSQPPHLSSSPDDANATQSMDITKDFHTRIHDNTTRKSFGGRRVSFAESVRVRLIEGNNQDNTNSTGSPQSSPIAETQAGHSSHPPNDENTYPGAPSDTRRRSSARYSIAYSEDMDLTSVGPQAFLSPAGSAIADEEFDYDDGDMDMTEVVHGDILRKRSLSTGTRPPLAQLSQAGQHQTPSDDPEQSQSFEESESQALSDADSDHSQPMDFTMPLSRSKRPPKEQDPVWLALRQATHSGDTPIEPELSSDDMDQGADDGMDLDDAVQRLMRARESLPSIPSIPAIHDAEPHDDTFSSAEDSFQDEGNQTMNWSAVLNRESLGGPENGRASMGSAMEESEVYGAIAIPSQSTPQPSAAAPEPPQEPPQIQPTAVAQKPAFTVFQPPSSTEPSNPSSTSAEIPRQQPAVPAFIPKAPGSPSKSTGPTSRPTSPVKGKQPPPRAGFSAAFAPPVARPSPNKRSRPSTDDGRSDMDLDRPSPAKRAATFGKWPAAVNNDTTSAAPSPKPQPKPLSPSKKAPFQAPAATTATQRPSSSLRRPSGYFAKRKSLGAAVGSQPREDEAPATMRSSPKKKAGLGLGRASMGSSSADAWQRFDKDTGSGSDKANEQAAHCDREAVRQAAASPTVTRGSPAPASPRPGPPAVEGHPAPPVLPVVDVSAVVDGEGNEEDAGEATMDVDATEQWRNAVEPNEFHEDEQPSISIKQFFAMTGIKFMDELTAPRRSTHPSQQSAPRPRDAEEIPLAEYVIAMGMDVPQLVLYSRVSKDLEAWIEKSKADFELAEDEAAKITPELFTEYSRADEEGQAELLHQLQLIRTNTRALAKSDWYDWKLQWLEGLRVTAAQTFKSLEEDARVLESIKASADEIIPALQQEYEEIMQELGRETAEVAEIEACDQDYLNELKASIAEQNIEVEALQAEVAESRAKLQSLQERLEETNAQKREAKTAIDDAQRVLHIQKNGTRAEVFKLKEELESLEDLHMFRVTRVDAEMFEYVYASLFLVSIPCKNFVPIVKRVDVTRVHKTRSKAKDNFPRLSDFLLLMAKEQVVRGENRTTRQIIHRLSDYWSSCAQLRAQLKLLTLKYPVEIEIAQSARDEPPSFKAKVMVLFPSVKGKALISFVFGTKTFCYWPVTIRLLRCEVEAVYGNIDRDIIINAVTDRLSQASPVDNYACLLDACIEAQEIYH
ncbi:putative spc7 kinetochore protein [Lyophyllum shimeji]|uniref:Spc7 kinetochore protein n=1 Tax=Lyophyllum shimeji TaxID=47721 RepID=A0A9P3UM85_LYOSH|nr:putative spc7 kinetochore protein [Lyophyllum shimeji]